MRLANWLAAGALVASCAGCTSSAEEAAGSTQTLRDPTGIEAAARPPAWAQRVDRAGLPNLHRITPALYRGAQPTKEGIAELARLGVKTMISLRTFHLDPQVDGVPIVREQIFFKSWHPEHEDILKFLKIVTDPARQPVFVHCQYGSDRTGMMSAIYRLVVEGWTKDEALREMTEGGFGFHPQWQNLVRFIRELDVEALRREAKLP